MYMSVPKGKRGISDMEFFKLSNELYDKFEDWLLRDFGIRDKVRKNKDEEQPLEVLQFPQWFIEHKRKIILSILDRYIHAIITANSIYPTNYTELDDRRHHQNHAISELEYLEQFMQRILRTMPLSKTKAAQYFDIIEHTISIVKLWRKSNGKIKKILDKNLHAAIQQFRKDGRIEIIAGWGLPDAAIEYIISGKGGEKENTKF
jgi:hypothetical protein